MNLEIKHASFWRSVFAEFLATMLFLFINCGVTLTWNASPTITQIALSFGLSIAVLAQIFGPSSGANINPAVSIGLAVTRRMTILRTMFYIVFQCAGGIAGAAICYAVSPATKHGSLGNVSLGDGVTRYQGFAVEIILTFILMLTVLAATDPRREDKSFGPALSIGLAVSTCHLVGIPYTGCGINPARSIGPAVVMNKWPHYHWIYWAGPILGAIIAALSYKFIFQDCEEEVTKFELTGLDLTMENNFTGDKGSKAGTSAM